MNQFLATMPPWAPLVVAAIGLTGALAAMIYARHAVTLACDRLETARDFERRLLNVLGRHPEILASQVAHHGNLAISASGHQQPQCSLEMTGDMLSRSPDRISERQDSWQQMALSLIAQSRFEDAEAVCRREVEKNPKNAQAHNALGVVLRKTNRLEAAVASCRRATLLEPSSVSGHINLGVALRNMGRLKQAEAAYRRAIQLDPAQATAHSSLGVALSKQGRHQEAEACYLQALEIDTRHTPAWLNLAIALEKRGAMEEAQAAYRCALELGTAANEAVEDFSEQAAVA